MITQPPRKGYGVIRISHKLTAHIAPLASISITDVQGDLHDRGVFQQIHQGLRLPNAYVILSIYFEVYRMPWRVLVEAPGVPLPREGEMLPVLIPRYKIAPGGEKELIGVEIAADPYHVLRVD